MVADSTPGSGGFGAWIRLLRPKEWIKNGFVLAPLVFSRSFTDPAAIIAALEATALFCLAASTVYILNDLRASRSGYRR